MLQRLVALFRNLAIYGLGDAATSIVGFLLLPVYTRFLTPTDYGVIGLLLTVEVVAKIVFRWGVDASFMRLYFDRDDGGGRQLLASTIFWFLVIVNGTALLLACLAAPFVARHLFGATDYAGLLQLSLVNIFVVGFYFLPFHVMRIEGRSPRFVAFTTARAVGTIVLRLWLVAGLGLGVLGFVVADLAVTAALAPDRLAQTAPAEDRVRSDPDPGSRRGRCNVLRARKDLYASLREIEALSGVMQAILMLGFAWNDAPHSGMTAMVTTESDGRLAADLTSDLAVA